MTFSGDQPCSTAIGRSSSAVASSADEGGEGVAERRCRDAWKGAFIVYLPCVVVVAGSAWRAGRRALAVGAGSPRPATCALLACRSRPGRGPDRRDWRSSRRGWSWSRSRNWCRCGPASRCRGSVQVGQPATLRAGAAGDDPDRARRRPRPRSPARRRREQQAVIGGDAGRRRRGRRPIHSRRLVDRDAVAVAERRSIRTRRRAGPARRRRRRRRRRAGRTRNWCARPPAGGANRRCDCWPRVELVGAARRSRRRRGRERETAASLDEARHGRGVLSISGGHQKLKPGWAEARRLLRRRGGRGARLRLAPALAPAAWRRRSCRRRARRCAARRRSGSGRCSPVRLAFFLADQQALRLVRDCGSRRSAARSGWPRPAGPDRA